MLNTNQSTMSHYKIICMSIFIGNSNKNWCSHPILHSCGMCYYCRASEASETLSGVYIHIQTGAVYVYVIARVGVKFGINFTSVRLSGNKIARGEAECYLPLNLTRVKFVPEISRLTVLLKINTIASLLFI